MAETKNDDGRNTTAADGKSMTGSGRDSATPQHPEVLPPSAIKQLDPVESAAMRARIESTPGGARYEEEAKKQAESDGREYGLKPGIGREEVDPPKREEKKRYRVESDEDKWTFEGQGPFKKGDIIQLDDAQAKRAGKNVRPA
jgi:hypothetical protein